MAPQDETKAAIFQRYSGLASPAEELEPRRPGLPQDETKARIFQRYTQPQGAVEPTQPAEAPPPAPPSLVAGPRHQPEAAPSSRLSQQVQRFMRDPGEALIGYESLLGRVARAPWEIAMRAPKAAGLGLRVLEGAANAVNEPYRIPGRIASGLSGLVETAQEARRENIERLRGVGESVAGVVEPEIQAVAAGERSPMAEAAGERASRLLQQVAPAVQRLGEHEQPGELALNLMGMMLEEQTADWLETIQNPAQSFQERPLWTLFDLVDLAAAGAFLGIRSIGTARTLKRALDIASETGEPLGDVWRARRRAVDQAADELKKMTVEEMRESEAADGAVRYIDLELERARQRIDESMPEEFEAKVSATPDDPDIRYTDELAGAPEEIERRRQAQAEELGVDLEPVDESVASEPLSPALERRITRMDDDELRQYVAGLESGEIPAGNREGLLRAARQELDERSVEAVKGAERLRSPETMGEGERETQEVLERFGLEAGQTAPSREQGLERIDSFGQAMLLRDPDSGRYIVQEFRGDHQRTFTDLDEAVEDFASLAARQEAPEPYVPDSEERFREVMGGRRLVLTETDPILDEYARKGAISRRTITGEDGAKGVVYTRVGDEAPRASNVPGPPDEAVARQVDPAEYKERIRQRAEELEAERQAERYDDAVARYEELRASGAPVDQVDEARRAAEEAQEARNAAERQIRLRQFRDEGHELPEDRFMADIPRDDPDAQAVLVAPEPQDAADEGMWRLTILDDAGQPSGHRTYASQQEAAEAAFVDEGADVASIRRMEDIDEARPISETPERPPVEEIRRRREASRTPTTELRKAEAAGLDRYVEEASPDRLAKLRTGIEGMKPAAVKRRFGMSRDEALALVDDVKPPTTGRAPEGGVATSFEAEKATGPGISWDEVHREVRAKEPGAEYGKEEGAELFGRAHAFTRADVDEGRVRIGQPVVYRQSVDKYRLGYIDSSQPSGTDRVRIVDNTGMTHVKSRARLRSLEPPDADAHWPLTSRAVLDAIAALAHADDPQPQQMRLIEELERRFPGESRQRIRRVADAIYGDSKDLPAARAAVTRPTEAPTRFEDVREGGRVAGQGVIPGSPRRSVPDAKIEGGEVPREGLFAEPEGPKSGSMFDEAEVAGREALEGRIVEYTAGGKTRRARVLEELRGEKVRVQDVSSGKEMVMDRAKVGLRSSTPSTPEGTIREFFARNDRLSAEETTDAAREKVHELRQNRFLEDVLEDDELWEQTAGPVREEIRRRWDNGALGPEETALASKRFKESDDVPFDIPEEAIEAQRAEDLEMAQPDVELSKSQLKKLAVTKRGKDLEEMGLVEGGALTQKGQEALDQNLRWRLMDEAEYTRDDAEEALELIDEVEALASEAKALDEVGDLHKQVRQAMVPVNKDFLEMAGVSPESLPVWFKKAGLYKPRGGAASVLETDAEGLFLVTRTGQQPERLMTEAEVMDILLNPRGKLRGRRDMIEEGLRRWSHGLASEDDIDYLARRFEQPEAAMRKLVMEPKKGSKGAEGGFRERLLDIVKRRRQAMGEATGPDGRHTDDDIVEMWSGFHLGIPQVGYDGVVKALYWTAEKIGDSPGVGSLLRWFTDKVVLQRFHDVPETETGVDLIRRWWDATYKYDPEYVAKRQRFLREEGAGETRAQHYFSRLTKLSETQERTVRQLLEGGLAGKREVEGVENLPAGTIELTKELRRLMDDLGAEAVRLGLLDEETYFRNYGVYMPWYYRKHVYERLGRKAGITRDQIEDLVKLYAGQGEEVDRIMRRSPKGSRMRLEHDRFRRRRDKWELIYHEPARTVGPPEPEMQGRLLDSRRRTHPETGRRERFRSRGPEGQRPLGRSFEKAEGPDAFHYIEEEIRGFVRGANRKYFDTEQQMEEFIRAHRLQPEQILTRAPISEELRKAMGFIDTAAYPVYQGLLDLTSDVALARFFDGIASNPKWVKPKLGHQMTKPEGYRSLGEYVAGNRRFDKLGSLRNMWIREDIADDIDFFVQMRFSANMGARKLTQWFKWSKVVANPATHARNIMSNMILADTIGQVPVTKMPYYFGQAAKEIRRYNRGDDVPRWFTEALEEGILNNTMFHEEMADVLHAWAIADGVDPVTRGSSYLNNLYAKATKGGKKAVRKVGNFYQAEEQAAKGAVFYYWREVQGRSARFAADMANKAIFDYGNVPPAIEIVRSSAVGVPFISFPFFATPALFESGFKNPLRIAKYVAFQEALNTASELQAKLDIDRERKTWGEGVSGLTMLPFVSEREKLWGVDAQWILPWGSITPDGGWPGVPKSRDDVAELAFAAGEVAGSWMGPFVNFGGPGVIAAAVAFNKDLFTGREVYNEDLDPSDQAWERFAYVWRSMAPNWAPGLPEFLVERLGGEGADVRGGFTYERAEDWFQGAVDQAGDLKQPTWWLMALDGLLGIRLRHVHPELERRYWYLEQSGAIEGFRRQIMQTQRRVRRHELTEKKGKKLMDAYFQDMKRLIAKVEDLEGTQDANDLEALERFLSRTTLMK